MMNASDLLSSLDSLLPRYETVLPFSQQTVSFVPFRVKDSKNISIILQENDRKLALKAMVDILVRNTTGCDVMNLCLADAEYLFLQIRSKSVEERLNLIHDGEKQSVLISEILPKNQLAENVVIDISNSVHLMLYTPVIKDIMKLTEVDSESMIRLSIRKISVNGEVYHTNKYLTDEMKEIINNLPLSLMPKFEAFLKNQPYLYTTIQTKDGPKEVSGFLRFFTYRSSSLTSRITTPQISS